MTPTGQSTPTEQTRDGEDENTDGTVDEGFDTETYYRDYDGDEFETLPTPSSTANDRQDTSSTARTAMMTTTTIPACQSSATESIMTAMRPWTRKSKTSRITQMPTATCTEMRQGACRRLCATERVRRRLHRLRRSDATVNPRNRGP